LVQIQIASGCAGVVAPPWGGARVEIEHTHVYAVQRFGNGEPRADGASHDIHATDGTSSLRILLVDDNEDAVRSVERLLEFFGYAVKGVTGGREALAQGAAFAPDVVVLDLGMPEMDGYETAAAIRSQPWGTHVRIVALTGWGEAEDIRRSLDAGFEAHLVKPLKLDELQNVLNRPKG